MADSPLLFQVAHIFCELSRKLVHIFAICREAISRYFMLSSGLHSQITECPAG